MGHTMAWAEAQKLQDLGGFGLHHLRQLPQLGTDLGPIERTWLLPSGGARTSNPIPRSY